jgi:hypothetical protein
MADRVDDLLASLTVDEKVTQFGSYQEPIPRLGIPGFQFWTGEGLQLVVVRRGSLPQPVWVVAAAAAARKQQQQHHYQQHQQQAVQSCTE